MEPCDRKVGEPAFGKERMAVWVNEMLININIHHTLRVCGVPQWAVWWSERGTVNVMSGAWRVLSDREASDIICELKKNLFLSYFWCVKEWHLWKTTPTKTWKEVQSDLESRLKLWMDVFWFVKDVQVTIREKWMLDHTQADSIRKNNYSISDTNNVTNSPR